MKTMEPRSTAASAALNPMPEDPLWGGKQVSGGLEGLGRRESSPEDDDLLGCEGIVLGHAVRRWEQMVGAQETMGAICPPPPHWSVVYFCVSLEYFSGRLRRHL